MKWLSNKYALPLVIFVIGVSILLQLAWLSQLYKAQRTEVKRDLEQFVGSSAEMSTYLSLVPGHEKSANFRNFFLSPEWLQFKQAYNNMRFNHIGSRFRSEIKGDSTFVDISLRILNNSKPKPGNGRAVRFDNGISLAMEKDSDRVDLKRMNTLIKKQLTLFGTGIENFYALYSYDDKRLTANIDHKVIKDADFVSQQYSYNLRFFGMYQLVIPSIRGLIIYRMRYYLLSSFIMLLLTVAVFLFILRLMNNQSVYTQARLSFTNNMTHELKTPVATIAIALESIIENNMESDPKALKNYLEISRNEIRRLNLMIDRVLNLEQLDSGQEKLRTELFDVQEGLSHVINSMQLQIKNAGALLKWQPKMDKPLFVSGDPIHLSNVFFNLIENALKYGGKGVKLQIDCQKHSNNVVISFKDNGPGIADIYRERIFERYFRISSGGTDIHNVKGTGLGLNYVKQVIEKHGGSITLTIVPSGGSDFKINLPLAE